MKTAIFLFFVLVLYATIAKAGLPPTTIKGQSDSAKSVNFNTQVPNNTATDLGGAFLIETGNTNILVNPSFEHSTVSTGWTSSGTGSSAAESSVVVHGKKSFAITTSSQTINLSQSSTLYQAQFADGVQGLASIRVKTTHTGTCSVCSVQAGTVSTTNCVSVTANNKWGLYKVPMILGATSNGISLACTSGTGLTYVDDAFVGAVDLKADVDQSRIAGVSYIPGTANCIFRRASTSLGAFSDINSVCPGPTILESSMGSWQTTDANTPRQTINNLPAGKYRLSVSFMSGPATSSDASFALTDGTTTCREHGVITTTAGQGTNIDCVFTYNSSGNRTFDLYGRSSTGSLDVYNQTGTGYSRDFVFTLTYLGSGSVYTSTNADFGWTSFTPTGGWSTNTTYTGRYRRDGENAEIEVAVSLSGAPTGDFSLNLPSGLVIDTAKLALATNRFKLGEATAYINAGSGNGRLLAEVFYNNTTTVSLGIMPPASGSAHYMSGVNATSPVTWASGDIISIKFSVPIVGWSQSNIIIGQFNGLESCANTLECTDTFSAKISSTGVVDNENVDWINGSCTNANPIVCTFNTGIFTVEPNCTATVRTSSGARVSTLVATSTTVSARQGTSGGDEANTVYLVCQKQGADYIGKTAKAVASDQNVRSIGSTNVDIQSVYFAGGTISTACSSSPCTIHSIVGGEITSVSRAGTGSYQLNGIDGLKYNCVGTGFNSTRRAALHDKLNSTTSYALINFDSVDTSYNSVICIGIP